MRHVALALALLLAAAAPAADPPKVTELPRRDPAAWAEVKAAPGRLLTLEAEPASTWTLVDDDGADLRPTDAGKFGDFCAPAPGRYKLLVTAPGGATSRVVVVVGDAPPGPRPPAPPKPADALKEAVAKAYAADPEPDADKKHEQARDLAALYRLIGSKHCKDAAITGAAQFVTFCREAADGMVAKTALTGVRAVVADELKNILPANSPLTDDQRDRLAKLFTRLADVLESL